MQASKSYGELLLVLSGSMHSCFGRVALEGILFLVIVPLSNPTNLPTSPCWTVMQHELQHSENLVLRLYWMTLIILAN